MSAASPGSAGTTSASTPSSPKSRNPVERAIVWGGIVVLLVVVGVEASAKFGYDWTLNRLQPAVLGDDSQAVHIEKDVPGMISGFPSREETTEGELKKVTYRWKGVIREYAVHMTYRPEIGNVLALTTDNPPPVPEKPVNDAPATPLDHSGAPAGFGPMMGGGMGGGGGGMGGGGGGRPPLNFADLDQDGDGKVTQDQLPERMQQFFDQIDENKDGSIDAGEFERRPRRGPGGGGAGGPNGGGPGAHSPDAEIGRRPQRPEADDSTAEQPASQTPAAESATNAEPAAETPEDQPPANPPATDEPATTEGSAASQEAPAGDAATTGNAPPASDAPAGN